MSVPNCACKFCSCALCSTVMTLLFLFIQTIMAAILSCILYRIPHHAWASRSGDMCHHSSVHNSSNKLLHTESSAYFKPSKYIQIFPLILVKLKQTKTKDCLSISCNYIHQKTLDAKDTLWYMGTMNINTVT